MRSLTTKMVIAFLAVSLVGIALLALVVSHMTATEFGGYVVAQEQEDLAHLLADFYGRQGHWGGVSELFLGRQGGMGPGPGGRGQGRGAGRNRIAVVDASGTVVVSGMGYQLGERVPASVIQGGAPIEVDGTRVGTVIQMRGAPIATAAGTTFLERINALLIASAVGATAIALLLGMLLARTLTRPLRELTAATQAVAQGDLGHEAPVHSRDELGRLATAFNQMSADLAQAQTRRQQMTADIAHELRTPVSIIQGHAEGLRDGVLHPNEETFALIHDEALRLNRMVEDLRTLTRAETGDLALLKRPAPVAPWLQGVVEAHTHRAAQRNIRLQTQIEADGMLAIDADRMAQVVDNLLNNALRHTPEGGAITVGTERNGPAIHLYIQNSGPGIAPQDLPHLFERFYRGDKARRRQDGGSGLGLAIARSIVEMHGGRIWAESEPGQGARFVIALPPAQTWREAGDEL